MSTFVISQMCMWVFGCVCVCVSSCAQLQESTASVIKYELQKPHRIVHCALYVAYFAIISGALHCVDIYSIWYYHVFQPISPHILWIFFIFQCIRFVSASYCGAMLNRAPSLISIGNTMRLHFATDSTYEYRGIVAHYQGISSSTYNIINFTPPGNDTSCSEGGR